MYDDSTSLVLNPQLQMSYVMFEMCFLTWKNKISPTAPLHFITVVIEIQHITACTAVVFVDSLVLNECLKEICFNQCAFLSDCISRIGVSQYCTQNLGDQVVPGMTILKCNASGFNLRVEGGIKSKIHYKKVDLTLD